MKFKATVHVFIKTEVLNPEEIPTLHALHKLGFTGFENIKMGRVFCITADFPDDEQAETGVIDACRHLLVNPVTETFRIEKIEEAPQH